MLQIITNCRLSAEREKMSCCRAGADDSIKARRDIRLCSAHTNLFPKCSIWSQIIHCKQSVPLELPWACSRECEPHHWASNSGIQLHWAAFTNLCSHHSHEFTTAPSVWKWTHSDCCSYRHSWEGGWWEHLCDLHETRASRYHRLQAAQKPSRTWASKIQPECFEKETR